MPVTDQHEEVRDGEYEDALRPPTKVSLEEAVRERAAELSRGAGISADDLALARRAAEFVSSTLTLFLRQNPALGNYYKMARAAIDIMNALPACAIEGTSARDKVAALVEHACNASLVIPNAKGMFEWRGRRYGPASGEAFIVSAVAELATVAALYPHEARTSPEPKTKKVEEVRQEHGKLPSLQDAEPFANFIAGRHGEYWLDWRHEGKRYMAKVKVGPKGITAEVGGELRGQKFDITEPVPLRRVSGWLFNVLRSLARAKHGGVPKPLQ